MAEPSASESSPDTDRDFDPSAEMLVHEFDDERTLDEEEAMDSGEDVKNELDELQKEGDMPLEHLLAIYGYDGEDNQADTTQSSSSEEILSNQDLTLDKEEIARDLLQEEDDEKEPSVNELLDNMDATVPTSRLLRSSVPHHQSESDSESEDEDYIPDEDEDWKKVTIQVGSDYQAVIPEGLCRYDDAPAYENDDKLLWDPSKLNDNEVDEYLRIVQQPSSTSQGVNTLPVGGHVRDDEQALYLLLQCGHNIEEAHRRRRMTPAPATDTMSLWSEEECRCFENGLRTYGKDFHLIQQNKVRTRSVGELVQFYYLWKKTERHDVFANKARLEKKKYTLHPGTTDYMDRFLDECENPMPHRDRSSSPNIHSLIAGDHKRHRSLNPYGSGCGTSTTHANNDNHQQQHHELQDSHSHHHNHHAINNSFVSSSNQADRTFSAPVDFTTTPAPHSVNPIVTSTTTGLAEGASNNHNNAVPTTALDSFLSLSGVASASGHSIEPGDPKNGIPASLEELAKNLTSHGLDRASLETLASNISTPEVTHASSSHFPVSATSAFNHQVGSLKSIDLIASLNSLPPTVPPSSNVSSLTSENVQPATTGSTAR